MIIHRLKKALASSAFFIACVSTLLLSQPAHSTTDRCCFSASETATIRHVHDGDTVYLSDNRKVRLIGIDTPEVARKKKGKLIPSQPFGIEARDFVRQLLKQQGSSVQLMPGIEKYDRYGRSLFHIQLADGSLLQQHLLEQGLAIANVYPPNTRLTGCYQQSENKAHSQHKKIWSHPKYQVKDMASLDSHASGFHIVKATVRGVGESTKAFWLNFNESIAGQPFSVRIDKRDIDYFKTPLEDFIDRSVIIRGWLKQHKKRAQISVRHPSAIQLVR